MRLSRQVKQYLAVSQDMKMKPTPLAQTPEDRLLAYSAYLSLKVKNAEGVSGKIMSIAKRAGGYILEVSNDRATLRVPGDSLQTALENIGNAG